MSHKPYFILMLTVLIWLLAACVSASGPGGINCENGVCVKLQLSEPIRFNEPGTVIITVETDEDEKNVQVGLSGYPPDIFIEGPAPGISIQRLTNPFKSRALSVSLLRKVSLKFMAGH